MEKKILNTNTSINIINNGIEIYTFYSSLEEEILAFITDEVKNLNGVNFKENEEGYIKTGYKDVSFFINEHGEFIVESDDPNRFGISSDGQLTITE